MGVDPTDPDAIADVFMNPAKRALIEEKIKAAEKHAAMTGLFDAASLLVKPFCLSVSLRR